MRRQRGAPASRLTPTSAGGTRRDAPRLRRVTERAIAAVAAAGALVAVAVVGSAAVGPATATAIPRRSDYQVAAVERVPAIRLAAIDAARPGRAPYRVHLPFAQLTGPLTPAETRVDASLASAARSTVAAFERRVEADVPPASLTGTRRLSTLDGVVTSNLVSSTIISFTVTVEASMAGAAHGLATVSTTNDSLVTGRSLQLAGLFRPGSRWLAALSARSRRVLGPELGLATTPQMLDPGTAPVASNFSAWALTPFGLAVTFQDYQVAAYAAGTPMLTIPYAALAGIARRGGRCRRSRRTRRDGCCSCPPTGALSSRSARSLCTISP